ncbi:FecR family protein [Pseudomonas sp. BN415]|nr:FecR family protein [Pseudomonas sp. BN415]
MISKRQSPPESLSEISADWCIRVHSDECTDAEREAFRRWCDADPSHAEEYAAMCRIWQVSDQLPPSPIKLAPPVRRHHRGVALLARAALIVMASGGLWGVGWSVGALPGSVRYYMAEDARREVLLPDRSQVDLNRRTAILYLGYSDRRRVLLSDGEAYFDVQRDVERPFVIRADNANVRVTGTHFNVWTASERTTVTVSQGSVLVSRDDGGSAYNQSAELTPGMQAVVIPNRPLQLGRADPASVAAWRKGRLMLDDVSLRDALPLINRYLDQPLRLADREVGDLRIGGIYETAELGQLVGALPQILPVTLRQADGALLLSRRGSF